MKFKFFLLLALATLVVAAGCSDKAVAPDNNQLTSQHGGYTATNEAPAFGDATLLAAARCGEVAYSDPVLVTPMYDSLFNLRLAHAFHFRAVWGHLVCDSTATAATNWDGSLELSRGLAVVRRTIHFEPATDSILPRTAWNKIEWTSQTKPCNDGIAVDLVVPPTPLVIDTQMVIGQNNDTSFVYDTLPSVPATLSFVTGPYSRIFSEAELAKLDTIITLPDGNEIAFTSFPVYEILCPRGSLTGGWTYTVDSQGTFSGVWRDHHGLLTGYIQGHFDITADSSHVFFGKWIDQTGLFEGFVQGTWRERHYGHGRDGEGMGDGIRGMHRFGWFQGDVLAADNSKIGVLKAKFTAGDSNEIGFFQGRWRVNCPDIKSDDMDDGIDEHGD